MSIIVIEGTDGCGKATQSNLLTQRLNTNNIKAFKQSFPNYGTAGAKPVETLLSGELGDNIEALDEYQSSVLFAVDRLWTYKSILSKHIQNGEMIILDRYVESNLLYQATRISAKAKYDEYVKWLLDFEYHILKLPKPDLIFYLNMPLNISKSLIDARGNKNGLSDDIYEKNKEYMENVYQKGLQIAKSSNFEIIECIDNDGNLKDIKTINDEIYNKINDKILAHNIEKQI